MRELLQQLRQTLEDALDCTLYPGTKRHDAAIGLLAAADAELAKPAPEPVAWIADVVRAVAELPDRNSPDDWPEAMLVTATELALILAEHPATPDLQARVEELERENAELRASIDGVGNLREAIEFLDLTKKDEKASATGACRDALKWLESAAREVIAAQESGK